MRHQRTFHLASFLFLGTRAVTIYISELTEFDSSWVLVFSIRYVNFDDKIDDFKIFRKVWFDIFFNVVHQTILMLVKLFITLSTWDWFYRSVLVSVENLQKSYFSKFLKFIQNNDLLIVSCSKLFIDELCYTNISI